MELMLRIIFSILYLVFIFDVLHCHKLNSTSSVNKLFLKNLSPNNDLELEELLFPESNFICDSIVNITEKYGFIKSPNYPYGYKVPISCQWNIIGTHHDEVITISFEEIDIEIAYESRVKCQLTSRPKDCCERNFLKISSRGNEQLYCGEGFKYNKKNVYISNSNFVSVNFNATAYRNNARGFYFSYIISPRYSSHCSSDEYRCNNGRCIAKQWICNGRHECLDGSDESGCESSYNSLYKCGEDDDLQFYDSSKKCDFKFDCRNKADELGCSGCPEDKFKCSSTKSCIDSSLICNGYPDCEDFSDELNCGFCPPNRIKCGTLASCYDPFAHRCNKILNCANGVDELNCLDDCRGHISCGHGGGCYDLSERCNGIVQCVDFSDELNCTEEICRAESGGFLCTGGRCIPSLWTCDRSNDCSDGSDEMKCLKNSVITAAIIGSLICGLLIVIAIGCACKLVALRHMEHYRSTLSSSLFPPGPFQSTDFPFPVTAGDLDASLFRLDSSVFFREPPPSYASTMGGYVDANGTNNSYMEQYRRYRRQRRCRRILRRQHRQQNGTQLPANTTDPIDEGNEVSLSLSNNDDCLPHVDSVITSDAISQTVEHAAINLEDSSKKINTTNSNDNRDRSKFGTNSQLMQANCSSTQATNPIPVNSSSLLNDNLNIELEPIPPLTNFDCDSQPLIR